jgi:hypothetical protein
MVTEFTPYTTGKSLFGPKPSWVFSDLDIQRIQSYQLYEEMYWNVPDVFKVSFRGTNDKPIYIPSAMTTVNTIDRYTGVDFAVRFTDRNTGTVSPDSTAASLAFQDLFARERFRSKYNGNKLYGGIRGDWLWHVTADPNKPQGARLSIVAIDPSMYFPITADDDVDDIIGCHLAVQITTSDGPRVHRLTYRKMSADNPGATGITVEEALFELNQWELPDGKPSKVIRPLQQLPAQITAVPVYHIKGFEEPGNPFGSSDLRGFESLMGRINQTVSDADLALALEGIGLYATDAPEPTDENGQPTGWRLGPGRVVQHPEGTAFNRVAGIDKVSPYTDHYATLVESLRQAAGTPDVAVGTVDVQVAQSGIALALQYLPITAKVDKKNDLIVDAHTQMCFDLVNGWYPAYEATTFTDVRTEVVIGSAVPIDRAARFQELNDMLDRKVIDTQYYRDEAAKLGYVFPEGIQARIDSEQQAAAANQAAAFGTGALVDNAGGANDGNPA